MLGKRIVIDTSKCIGCRACQVACKQWHSLEAEDTTFTGSYQNPPDMSGANLNVVKFKEVEVAGKLKWLFFKDQCRHCQGAWCAQACPRKAITQLPTGIVKIDPAICDPNKCGGGDIKPCQNACYFDVPKFNYVKNGSTVTTKMMKCDCCYDRLGNLALPAASRRPACMVACPPGVITAGLADDMWAKAVARGRLLRSHGFPNATIYPHQNATWGQTHVIWILTDDWRLYDLPGYGYY